MDVPVPILALARLKQRMASGIVALARTEHVPVLLRLVDTFVIWREREYATSADEEPTPTDRAPGALPQYPIPIDDFYPTAEEAEEIARQTWEDNLRWEAEAESAAVERAEFKRLITIGVAQQETGWVQCPYIVGQLDHADVVRVTHVTRWLVPVLGKPFGILLSDDGSPGLRRGSHEFCVPPDFATALVRRAGESDEAVTARTRTAVNEVTAEWQAEHRRREAALAVHMSRWQKPAPVAAEPIPAETVPEMPTEPPAEQLAEEPAAPPRTPPWLRPMTPEMTQRREERKRQRDEEERLRIEQVMRSAESLWHLGEEIPATRTDWCPLQTYLEGRKRITAADILAHAAGRFVLHVYAHGWRVAYVHNSAQEIHSLSAKVRVEPKSDASYGVTATVAGPVALDARDAAVFLDDPAAAIDVNLFTGTPYLELDPPDAKDAEALLLVDPPSVTIRLTDLWIGPHAQRILTERLGDTTAAVADAAESARAVDLIRVGALSKALIDACRKDKPNDSVGAKQVAELARAELAKGPQPLGEIAVEDLETRIEVGLAVLLKPGARDAEAEAALHTAGRTRVIDVALIGGLAELLSLKDPNMRTRRRVQLSQVAERTYGAIPEAWRQTHGYRTSKTIADAISEGLGAIGRPVSKPHTRG